jgi:hypothetical protein
MRSILDRSFRYTPSFDTDVRRTFERVRRERCEVRPIRSDYRRAATGASADTPRRSVERESMQPAQRVAQAAG